MPGRHVLWERRGGGAVVRDSVGTGCLSSGGSAGVVGDMRRASYCPGVTVEASSSALIEKVRTVVLSPQLVAGLAPINRRRLIMRLRRRLIMRLRALAFAVALSAVAVDAGSRSSAGQGWRG